MTLAFVSGDMKSKVAWEMARWLPAERAGQRGDLAERIVGVLDEVNDRDEEEGDGLGEVEGGMQVGVFEDGVGAA